MTLGERIKKVRRSLDLTQQEFADRIGMKRNSIAQVETGRNTSEQTIFSICREFSVNEEWLRTGKGEMFRAAPSGALDALAATYHLTNGEYALIEKFVGMKPESRQVIVDYILEVSAALSFDDTPADDPAISGGFSSSSMEKIISLNSGKKNTAAARSGDRMETVSASAEEEEAVLPAPSDRSDI